MSDVERELLDVARVIGGVSGMSGPASASLAEHVYRHCGPIRDASVGRLIDEIEDWSEWYNRPRTAGNSSTSTGDAEGFAE